MKNTIIYMLLLFATLTISNLSYSQEWESINYAYSGSTMDFLNANTGYIGVTLNLAEGYKYAILKTTDKGANFSDPIWKIVSDQYNSKGFAFDMVNEQLGFVYVEGYLYKTINGGNNWTEVFGVRYGQSVLPTIKFFNQDLGFITYTQDPASPSDFIEVWKITNSGQNRSRVYTSPTNQNLPVIADISISQTDPNQILMVGYYHNFNDLGQKRKFALKSTNGGDGFGPEYDGGEYGTFNTNVTYLPGSSTEFRILSTEYYGVNDLRNGAYCYYDIEPGSPKYKISNLVENIGGLSFVDHDKGYAYVQNKLYKTTNSGVNWSEIYTYNVGSFLNRNSLNAYNDIIYCVEQQGSFLTHKLPTNLNSYIDNQLGSGFMSFDGISYTTSGISFLRGGNSTFSSSTINPNLSNEKIFYKWYDGYMGNSKPNYYLDMSGTTISNYYKTKQLSTSSKAIGYPSQSKSVRDTTVNNVTATHTIHESIGGIFYSKSTNFGETYQTEEVVNLSDNTTAVDGNKNAYLTIMRASGGLYPITTSDANRNVAVVWEKYNSITQQIEIKFAHRVLNTQQNGYEWKTYKDNNNHEYLTSFDAPSGFESKPKCFVAVYPGQTQEGPFLIIVPHLRPNGSQNKIFTSVRYTPNQSQDYELENGYIQDLAVTSPFNYYSSYIVHFAYLKDDKVAYRREEFGYYNGNIYRGTSPPPEVNNNISSGDGYASRYKPDISLMNGIPVVSYSANYNAYAMIDYENGGTDIIQISRYPVIKVERKGINDWGDYIIYNSVNVQGNPDIEGSADTKSYLINYSAGNGLFKKVVNVESHPGYFCDPNTFSGTDSRLIKNSYTGYFGNSLSLLTLSPNAGLYKLDKQNFNITNIVTADAYDNLGGVINLDTVRYSFNLGPLLIKEPNDDIEEISFDPKYTPPAPVMTPVEFNQNLRSNPFLLNESQALLVGCNVTYLKDDIDAVINEVRYSVDLMNKSTDSLHRVLYSDTIHADDSIATEYLRGYYITGIPNGEDSFYVKITVNNEDIAEGNFNINPGYDDNSGAGDNSSGYRTKIMFENSVVENTTNIIPGEYSLEQNYPNPFNPTTHLEFGISKLGFVSLKVFDILGKEVKTLVNEIKQPGTYGAEFDGSNLASGIYFYQLEAGSFVQTKRMLLIK